MVDYDQTDIAATYDRGRSHSPELLGAWMRRVESYAPASPKTIVDLGCGTGRFSGALAKHFGADVIGVDPSHKMLEHARAKKLEHVRFEVAKAESIPLADASVDLVFISMIFHHLEDHAKAARECWRILRKGGIVFLRGGVRESIPAYPFVEFFPPTLPMLEEDLQTGAFVRDTFEAAGFGLVEREIVTQEVSPSLDAYADKIALKADSIIARLSDADFEAGMRAIRARAASIAPAPVYEPVDVFVFRSIDV